MEITMSRHDCSQQLAAGEQPTQFYIQAADAKFGRTVARSGRWYVLQSVVGDPAGLRWHQPHQGEEKVRIPLFSYTTASKSLEDLLAVAVHLTLSVASNSTVGLDHVEQAHVVVGSVYDAGGDKGYQIWIGIAFRTP